MATTAAVEWKIAIEGTDVFGEVRRHEIRVEKSWDRLFDGEIGLSVDDGKKVMAALQTAVVNQEAGTYALFRRICPDCGVLRPVKDYTTRRIRTVFGTVEVRNPRWMLCRNCHPAFAVAFAPLQEICPDRATVELTELTARLGSMMPYRQAATVMAEFLPIEPTETHATVRKRTIRTGERLDRQTAEEERRAASQMSDRRQLELELPSDRRREFVISIDTAHVRSADPKSARNFELVVARCGRGGRGEFRRPLFRHRRRRSICVTRSSAPCSRAGRVSRLWRRRRDFGRRRNPETAAPSDAETHDPHHRLVSYRHENPAHAADRRSHSSISAG